MERGGKDLQVANLESGFFDHLGFAKAESSISGSPGRKNQPSDSHDNVAGSQGFS